MKYFYIICVLLLHSMTLYIVQRKLGISKTQDLHSTIGTLGTVQLQAVGFVPLFVSASIKIYLMIRSLYLALL